LTEPPRLRASGIRQHTCARGIAVRDPARAQVGLAVAGEDQRLHCALRRPRQLVRVRLQTVELATEPRERLAFELADPLPRDPELLADRLQRGRLVVVEPEAELENAPLALAELRERRGTSSPGARGRAWGRGSWPTGPRLRAGTPGGSTTWRTWRT